MPNKIDDEDDARIVDYNVTIDNENGGRKSIENLLQKDHKHKHHPQYQASLLFRVYEALKAVGMEKSVMIFSVESSRLGVKDVDADVIGTASQQYILLIVSLGIEAIRKFADNGEKPKPTEGKGFFNTGVALVTNKPTQGVESINVKASLYKCWS